MNNTIIRASAGTGKTFQLANRFLGLLQQDVGVDRVLATTFTRKAAGEILDRVIVRLAEASLVPEKRKLLGSVLPAGEISQEQVELLLRRLLAGLHRLRISTLDSFFAQVARGLSLELDLPPGWRLLDELEDGALRDEALEQVLSGDQTRDLLNLTHLLTKGDASRTVAELLRGTINDLYELFLDTDQEAWQRVPRGQALTDGQLRESLEALRELQLPGKRFTKARDADLQAALCGDWASFVTGGLAQPVAMGATEYGRQPISEEMCHVYRPLLMHARAVLVGRVHLQTEASYRLLSAFHQHYRRLKQQRRGLRFEDITRQVGRVLQLLVGPTATDSADFSRLAFRLDGRIDHLLLDEFQDTSPAQWRAIRPFAEGAAGGGPRRSFFCVGDVKQAIYGWRGGVAEIFDAIQQQLPEVNAEALNLSYRSAPPIVEGVNQVFQRIDQHPNLDRRTRAVRQWMSRYQEHQTVRHDLQGHFQLMVGVPSGGELASQAALPAAASLAAERARRSPKASVGVLVRRNETVRKLIHLLREQGITASEEGGNPVTDSAAVQLILSLLRLADHPGDATARFHVLKSPWAACLAHTDDVDQSGELARRVRRQLNDHGYGGTVLQWSHQLLPHADPREATRLEQLVELAYQFPSRASIRCHEFIAYVQHQRVADPLAANVRVMTVHQAKGLEFDSVILPELDVRLVGQPPTFVIERADPTQAVTTVCRHVNSSLQKLLPKQMQAMFDETDQRSLTESLCLLYVALTRAVHSLCMIVTPSPSNERRLPQTFAGLLRAALTDGRPAEAGVTLFELGDAAWDRGGTTPPCEMEPSAAHEPRRTTLARVKLDSHRQRRRGLDRYGPSSLEGGAKLNLGQLLRPENQTAMLRGSIVHAWFEHVSWLDDGRPSHDELRQIARSMMSAAAAGTVAVPELLSEFERALDRPDVSALLSRKAYHTPRGGQPELQVEHEYEFAIRESGSLVTGSVDRLVLVRQSGRLVAAEVVDFKTDRLRQDDPALTARVEFYRPQMESYCQAMARHLRLDRAAVTARLLFTGPGVVVPV